MVWMNPFPSPTEDVLSARPFRGSVVPFILVKDELGDAVPLVARLGVGVVGSGNGRGWCLVETMVR